jgi:predicted RNA binding protein YcfA (HicA-like mRNA interferase family)
VLQSARYVVKILSRFGFVTVFQRGSHVERKSLYEPATGWRMSVLVVAFTS